MASLSVIVPTFNEAANVRPLLERIARALAGIDYDLTFVDDSTDGTAEVLAALAQEAPRLRVVHRQDRRGLASAVTEGIALARGDVVCVLDADLQHPPEIVPALLEALERTGADLAIASRYVPGGSNVTLSPSRRLVSHGAIALARLLLARARPVADPVSGFFAFRRRIVQGVSLRPIGYKILLEVLVRGNVTSVVEVPYRFDTREAGESKLTLAQNWLYLKHVLALAAVRPADADALRLGVIALTAFLVNAAALGLLASTAAAGRAPAAAAAVGVAVLWSLGLGRTLPRGGKARGEGWDGRHLGVWRLIGVAVAIQLAALVLLRTLGAPAIAAGWVAATLGWGGGLWAAIRWVRRSDLAPIRRIVFAPG
jgi:dolichol-phosphate mannosyltransferase